LCDGVRTTIGSCGTMRAGPPSPPRTRCEHAVEQMRHESQRGQPTVRRRYRNADGRVARSRSRAIDLVVLMIDGVVIEEHVLLVALGIDVDGKKHVLGVREGAPENASSCTALI